MKKTITETREKPILFSGPMVRAILSGSKTQTRRLLKPQPTQELRAGSIRNVWRPKHAKLSGYEAVDRASGPMPCCVWNPDIPVMETGAAGIVELSRYQAGMRLWVRETWGYFGGDEYLYQRDRSQVGYAASHGSLIPVPGGKWRPSIFMPRWASRITLEVTGVRVERVQEMTPEDLTAEGFPPDNSPPHDGT